MSNEKRLRSDENKDDREESERRSVAGDDGDHESRSGQVAEGKPNERPAGATDGDQGTSAEDGEQSAAEDDGPEFFRGSKVSPALSRALKDEQENEDGDRLSDHWVYTDEEIEETGYF